MKKSWLSILLALYFSSNVNAEMFIQIPYTEGITVRDLPDSGSDGSAPTLSEESTPDEWVNFANNECGYLFSNISELEAEAAVNGIVCDNVNFTALPSGTGLPDTVYELEFSSNQITDITGLSNVTTVTFDIDFGLSINLTSLKGLSNLQSVEDLYVNNSLITDLNGLQSLTSFVRLVIHDNVNLTSLTGLVNPVNNPVNNVDIDLEGNPNLADISALSPFTVLDDLDLMDTNVLTDLNGLQNVTVYDSIDIEDNNGLLTLNGLEGATEVRLLDILRNPNLDDISALRNITETTDIDIDRVDFTIGLPSDSWLCNDGANRWDYTGGAFNINDLCNQPPTGSGDSGGAVADPQWEEWTTFLSSCDGYEWLDTNLNFSFDIESRVPSTMYSSDINTQNNITNDGIFCGGNEGALPTTSTELTSIPNIFFIATNLSTLPNLSGITGITDHLVLIGNGSLTDLTELSEVVFIGGNIIIKDSSLSSLSGINPSIVISGDIDLSSNSLSNINTLSGVNFNGKNVLLNDNPLNDISALSGVSNLQDLILTDTNLSNVNALSSLISANDVFLNRVPLSDISGLSSLTTVEDLWITGGSFGNLNALSNLPNVGRGFVFQDNNNLTDISGLSNASVNDINGQVVIESTGITNLSSLSGITRVQMMRLETSATSLNGLQNLSQVNTLTLLNNPNLTDISALAGITNLGFNLVLPNNTFTTKIPASAPICTTYSSRVHVGGQFTDAPSSRFCD